MLQINLGFAALILIFVVVITVRYILVRKTQKKMWTNYYELLQEQEVFLNNFIATPFDDFGAFDFVLGRFSHVSPFPRLVEGTWRYTIYLTTSEAEDIITIAHEISECSLGRIIERLLDLKRPLFLLRKQGEKFSVRGKKQQYLVEHFVATLGEVEDLTPDKLRERLNKDEIESLI